MSLPPEFFRGMSPDQMTFALTIDEHFERERAARKAGAKCSSCMDTGMDGGRLCGCEKGSRLAVQAFGGSRP